MATEVVEEAQVPLGLLDQPVVVEGKRKRKATNQYNVGTTVAKKKVAIKHTGSGTKLQDIPSVEHSLTEKFRADDLRMLYKLCFEVNGKATTLKKELKQFRGFGFDKDSEEYKKKKAQLNKLNVKGLTSQFCAPLCLSGTGTKEEIIDRILEFLLNPTDSGKTPKKKKVTTQKKKVTTQRKKKEKSDKSTDDQETAGSGEVKSNDNDDEPSDGPSTAATTKDEDGDENEE